MTQEMSKSAYSLFGDKEKGYRRFLYDPYLPRSQNADACNFDLTARDIKYYYDIAWDLTNAACATLVSALGEGHRVWSVDRFLITSMMHAILYGDAAGRLFLSQHGDEIDFFVARYHGPALESMGLVEYPLTAIDPGLTERALCNVLERHGIRVIFESRRNGQATSVPFYRKARALLGDIKRSAKEYFSAGKILLAARDTPVLIYSNIFLDQEELEKLSRTLSVHPIDGWAARVIRGMRRRVWLERSQCTTSWVRETWRRSLAEIGAQRCDGTLGELLPVVADLYPTSLLEERAYLLKEARRLVKLLRFGAGKNHIALSVDHRIWKFEWTGALAQALTEEGCFVVGTQHGPYRHWRCNLMDSVEQIPGTYFAAFSKNPFVRMFADAPTILPIRLPTKFRSVSGCRLEQVQEYSIWYFPHHVDRNGEDGTQCYFVNHYVRPENYFERTASILAAFGKIAENRKVKEIVIKHKADNTKLVDQYRTFVSGFVEKDSSGKIRLADRHMTMPEALPFVSIAVHDIFSTGAVQTMLYNIPTIILLGTHEEILEDLRDYDRWIELGVLLKDADLLVPVLTKWMESGHKLPEHIFQSLKEDWCGDGNPTLEVQLRRLLTFRAD